MKYHYVYYSYEEYGRGYIGSRTCKCLPEEDLKYFGSFRDKTFKPTQKIILKSDYSTREEALADEIILHDYYDVANNLHFSNKAKQTSAKFCLSEEQASELGKRNGKIGSKTNKKNKTSIFSLTTEELSEAGKKGGTKSAQVNKENKNCIFGLSKDQLSENGKKGGKRCKELGLGIHGISGEERTEISKRGVATTNSQRWKCTETGFISSSGPLTNYQRRKGIDTSKRIRLS